MRAKNITAKQFAEEIGIQPSGMSHIMSGRNNPSLDFVSKVIRRYPEIDANWLLMGKGEMYSGVKDGGVGMIKEETVQESAPTLFSVDAMPPAPSSSLSTPSVAESNSVFATEMDNNPSRVEKKESRESSGEWELQSLHDNVDMERHQERDVQKEEPATGRRLVKILFFYDDRTFEEYRPL